MAKFDQEIDITGERCPVPVFKTQKTLLKMEAGEVLRVITDDPVSMTNMNTFVEINPQYVLQEAKQEGKGFFFLIKKTNG